MQLGLVPAPKQIDFSRGHPAAQGTRNLSAVLFIPAEGEGKRTVWGGDSACIANETAYELDFWAVVREEGRDAVFTKLGKYADGRGDQRGLQDWGGDGRLRDVREEGGGVCGTSRRGGDPPPDSTTPLEDRDRTPSKPRVSEG